MKVAGFANKSLAAAAVLLLLTWLGIGLVLSSGKQLELRHEAISWNEPFDFANGNWDSYVAWSERQLRAAYPDTELPPGLLPYRREPPADCPVLPGKPQHNGIILTHDIRQTPYLMYALAEYFQERCFVVLVPLLPHHGTRPGDLATADWQQWAALEAMLVRELALEVNNLFVGGHGAGATLALHEAQRNDAVDALLLFAPLLEPLPRSWRDDFAPLVQGLFPAARWERVLPDDTPWHFDSEPQALRRQVDALVAATVPSLPGRSARLPVFMVASAEDAVAPLAPILEFMRAQQHPDSRAVVYSLQELAEEPRVSVVSSAHPDLRLYGLGHGALVLPLSDTVFGEHGSYRDCAHYFRISAELWTRCREGEVEYYGVPLPENLARGLLRNPSHNQFHTSLLRAIDPFVAPVGRVPEIRPR